ncbi:MAG: acyl-CoA dehydrogenase family protein, partial [candidate division WOR-3 bacterium]|nr:acyl-CoA dehydrogenase family protein [candidate division WOR-3 bacterium]
AWTDQEKRKKRDHSGISCFIVERSFPGVTTATIHGKLGIRAGNTGSISLSDVRVPKENMLGQEGEGFKIAMFALDQGRYTVAAGATGLIRACLDASVKYANERKTFGEVIGKHQLVKEMIADMAASYEIARLLWLKAGWLKNIGERNTKETSLAKMYACDASERAASNAVQIYGAYGYSDEYPVERFYRNSKGAVIYEGSREIHKLMQADYALGYRSDKPTRCKLPTPEE